MTKLLPTIMLLGLVLAGCVRAEEPTLEEAMGALGNQVDRFCGIMDMLAVSNRLIIDASGIRTNYLNDLYVVTNTVTNTAGATEANVGSWIAGHDRWVLVTNGLIPAAHYDMSSKRESPDVRITEVRQTRSLVVHWEDRVFTNEIDTVVLDSWTERKHVAERWERE